MKNLTAVINTIVYSNFLPIVGLIILLFFVSFNFLFSKKQTRLFFIAISINLFMILVVTLDYIFSKLIAPDIYLFRRITSFLNFAASPLIPLLLYKIYVQKKSSIWFYLPLAVNGVVCLISVFVNLVFYITYDNGYERGALFFLPFITSIIYICILMIQPGSFHAKSRREERILLVVVILLLVSCMALEILSYFRFLTWDGAALGLIMYYLLLNINRFIVDPLTNAYNRSMYTNALNKIEGKAPCLVALMDINDFKLVNDLQGHDTGDRCLVGFVEVIDKHLPRSAVLYRIGGDEFVILMKKPNLGALESSLAVSREELSKAGVTFAIGVAAYQPEDKMEDTLKQADILMYENKTKLKEHAGL